VGSGHKERRRSIVDGEEWRRPWRRVRVPSEGLANTEEWSAHEHRGFIGMLFRYLVRLEVGGAEGGRRRGGGSGFTGGNGGTVFWWLGCRRVVKKLLGSFYGMMWCCWCPWLGLRGFIAASGRRGRAAAELELTGAAGDDSRVREIGIGWVSELQVVAVVLLEHWIAGGRRRGRLTTAARGCGGVPARCGARERKWQWKCRRVKARGSAWEAPGCARDPEEGVVTREQELASRRESWRLGRWRRDVEKRGEGQRGVGSGGTGAGAARGAMKGGAGRLVCGTWPMRAAGSGAEKQRRGLEVDEGGSVCNFPKVQGLHCKA
jgi:hypothetical protein